MEPTREDIELCRRGDPRGLEGVHRALGDRVYRLSLGLLGQPADAEDATQEVLLRLLDKARTFRGRSRFSTWVYRLTVNHCRNRRRTRRMRSLGDVPEAEQPAAVAADPVQETSAAEERAALQRLLAELSHDHRAVLVLRDVEGLSYPEIAEVLELPQGTVMSRLARARDRLAALAAASSAAPAAGVRAALAATKVGAR